MSQFYKLLHKSKPILNQTSQGFSKHHVSQLNILQARTQEMEKLLKKQQHIINELHLRENKTINHWNSLDFLIAISCGLFSVDIILKHTEEFRK